MCVNFTDLSFLSAKLATLANKNENTTSNTFVEVSRNKKRNLACCWKGIVSQLKSLQPLKSPSSAFLNKNYCLATMIPAWRFVAICAMQRTGSKCLTQFTWLPESGVAPSSDKSALIASGSLSFSACYYLDVQYLHWFLYLNRNVFIGIMICSICAKASSNLLIHNRNVVNRAMKITESKRLARYSGALWSLAVAVSIACSKLSLLFFYRFALALRPCLYEFLKPTLRYAMFRYKSSPKY